VFRHLSLSGMEHVQIRVGKEAGAKIKKWQFNKHITSSSSRLFYFNLPVLLQGQPTPQTTFHMATHLLEIAGMPPKKRRLNESFAPIQFTIDYGMHAENRGRVVERLKSDASVASVLVNGQAMILMQGGISQNRNETDHELMFRQESSFQYLFGVREPDCYGALDVSTGKSYLFVPRLPASYVIFMGEIHSLEWFQTRYSVDQVNYTDEIDSIFSKCSPSVVYVNHGLNTDSGAYAIPANFSGIEKYRVDNGALYRAIVDCRVIKTEREIEILRYVNNASSDAHVEVMRRATPGMAEYQLESLFRHFTYFKYVSFFVVDNLRYCSSFFFLLLSSFFFLWSSLFLSYFLFFFPSFFLFFFCSFAPLSLSLSLSFIISHNNKTGMSTSSIHFHLWMWTKLFCSSLWPCRCTK